MDYPKQEHRSGNSQRATVAMRDVVDIYKDSAKGGNPNPKYDCLLVENVLSEILQVAGGEIVRGIQVEGITTFVVSIPWLETLAINEQCEVKVNSGIYEGWRLFAHRVHTETGRMRPKMLQLHCKART